MGRNVTTRSRRTITRFVTPTSSSAPTVAENAAFSQALTATSDLPITWEKQPGFDSAQFTLTGSTLTMAAKDFEAPVDANADNVYEVVVKATDERGHFAHQHIKVRVTDVGAA